jgi:Zn ribbon nucleic-acid-binding protein
MTEETTDEMALFRRAEVSLRRVLACKHVTGWKCPTCGWEQYKVYGLECDQCGFDAAPYQPQRERKA